ncbi:MAG: PilZ domain-containing protein [Gammaproteobacteria bacterium]|nr:PilZ domain-containing protein [Gammaproteobacteria bacterium]
MDHRCGERHPAGTTVLVRRRGWAGWVVAELENISVSGALLKLERGELPRHALVRLEASSPGESSGRLLHGDAVVARASGNRVGLAFDRLAPPGLAPLLAKARHSVAALSAYPVAGACRGAKNPLQFNASSESLPPTKREWTAA